jgi:hypothetical protein
VKHGVDDVVISTQTPVFLAKASQLQRYRPSVAD